MSRNGRPTPAHLKIIRGPRGSKKAVLKNPSMEITNNSEDTLTLMSPNGKYVKGTLKPGESVTRKAKLGGRDGRRKIDPHVIVRRDKSIDPNKWHGRLMSDGTVRYNDESKSGGMFKRLKKNISREAGRLEKSLKREGSRFGKALVKAGKDTGNMITGATDLAKGAVDTAQNIADPPSLPDIKIPDPPKPPAADAQFNPDEEPAPEFGGEGSEGSLKARKKGRKSLRISLRAGNAGAGGTGLNVPKG